MHKIILAGGIFIGVIILLFIGMALGSSSPSEVACNNLPTIPTEIKCNNIPEQKEVTIPACPSVTIVNNITNVSCPSPIVYVNFTTNATALNYTVYIVNQTNYTISLNTTGFNQFENVTGKYLNAWNQSGNFTFWLNSS